MEILAHLKAHTLLHADSIVALKQAIHHQYPYASTKQRATVFASAVHKIVENNMPDVDVSTRDLLRHQVLVQAVHKQVFSIELYDVVVAFLKVPTPNSAHLSALRNWIMEKTPFSIGYTELTSLLDAVQKELDAALLTMVTTVYRALPTASPITPIPNVALPLTLAEEIETSKLTTQKSSLPTLMVTAATLLLLLISALGVGIWVHRPVATSTVPIELDTITSTQLSSVDTSSTSLVTQKVYYQPINEGALYTWLQEKNSLLADAPYFQTILDAALEFEINPLLLFAIAGQEQGFVPKSHPDALTIGNNPFNVFGSWKKYNTHITDTARIAARTLVTLSQDCPIDADPIAWINLKYAEDQRWHIGVSSILSTLETVALIDFTAFD